MASEIPEVAVLSVQWIFGAILTLISAVVGYLFNWNTRIEQKIDREREATTKAVYEQRIEFKDDLERALSRQTTQIIQLMDARLDIVGYRDSRGKPHAD